MRRFLAAIVLEVRRLAAAPFVLGVVLGLGLVLGSAGPIQAQTMADAQRTLEVTQAVIDRATSATSCTSDESRLACAYIAQATTLQQSARASYGGGFYRDAIALSLRARDRAYSALRTAQDATGGEFVRLSIERTDALIERVSVAVRESESEAARRQLDQAAALQRKARSLAEAGRPRAALSATAQARDRALRALRLAEDGARATPERARLVLERTDDLLRIASGLADHPVAGPLFARARTTEERAWSRLRAGAPLQAIDLSLSARDQLAQAYERADRRERPRGR
jgi:hypothetical protein